MEDDGSVVDEVETKHVVGGDAVNVPLNDKSEHMQGNVNGCARRQPFLIGVAGGTASGKVTFLICSSIVFVKGTPVECGCSNGKRVRMQMLMRIKIKITHKVAW